MSKHRCPLCRRKGWEAKRKTWKLWREAVRQGIPVLDYADSPAAHEELRQQLKQEIFGDKPPHGQAVPAPGFGEMNWSAMAGYAGGDLVQPVKTYDAMLQEDLQRYKNAKSEARRQRKRESNRRWLERHPNYSREYYARKKVEKAAGVEAGAEVEDELGDNALDYAEKQNEKLARDREYQRVYYHKNKERIDRLRKARTARQAQARRSPTTGDKANGH